MEQSPGRFLLDLLLDLSSCTSCWTSSRGLVIAPAYFKVVEHGEFRGVSVSAFNHIVGRQRGLTVGLLNIAEELHGLQVGLINIARNKRSFSVLPILNYHR